MITKNKMLLIIVSILFISGSLQAQWNTVNVQTKENLNSIGLLSENSGWIVGDNGTILYKNKDVWVEYMKITDEDLYSICLIDKNNGWAVGSGGAILRFNGKTWEKLSTPTKEKLFSVSFKDIDNGIAVGTHGAVLIYKNGDWTLTKKTTQANLFSVSTKNDISLVGGGLECVKTPIMKLTKTEDNKLIRVSEPRLAEIKGITIPFQNDAWAVGSRGVIIHFDGIVWKKLEQSDKLPTLNSIFFSNENKGIIVGYSGTILTYSGETWTREDSPVNAKLNGSAIFGNTYYAVGNDGTILSNTLKSEIISPPAIDNISGIKIVSYPNPAADAVKVIIPEEIDFSAGQITITNTNGQVIYKNKLSPNTGGQVYEVNTSELSTGFYFINITSTTGITASGKLIVKH